MADEILHSTLEADLRQASMISRQIRTLLTHNASIRRTGNIPLAGDVAGTGSDTMKVRQAGLGGRDSFASATEIEDVANTQLTDDSFDLAVTRYALVRGESDLAWLTGMGPGDINPFLLAADMSDSFEELFNSLVATAGATATTNVGSAATDYSADVAFDAVFALQNASVRPPFFGMNHPVSLGHLQDSLRGETGALAFMEATQKMLDIKGQGFSGRWLQIDWFHDPNITENGGGKENFVAGRGAIEHAIGTLGQILTGNRIIAQSGTPVVVEFEREGTKALTRIIGHAYTAVSVAEQARLVGALGSA